MRSKVTDARSQICLERIRKHSARTHRKKHNEVFRWLLDICRQKASDTGNFKSKWDSILSIAF